MKDFSELGRAPHIGGLSSYIVTTSFGSVKRTASYLTPYKCGHNSYTASSQIDSLSGGGSCLYKDAIVCRSPDTSFKDVQAALR